MSSDQTVPLDGVLCIPPDIIGQITDYLRYKIECGERTVELDNASAVALFTLARSAAKPVKTPPDKATGQAIVASVTPCLAEEASKNTATTCHASDARLDSIAEAITACAACRLCSGRTRTVPGQGNFDAPDVMFIGEAPGAEEDRQGLAFVGRAGELLTKMIAAMGYSRDQVFIANICKCRPPENRQPTPEEMAACMPFLLRQIDLIRPKTIVALGNTAILGLLGDSGITRLRGIWTSFHGIPLMPTFHPAYLLRFPAAKRAAWEDLQKVMKKLGRPIPTAKASQGN